MADRTITIKKYDGSNWDNFYPKTTIAQVINLSTQLANMESAINGKAPSAHTHVYSDINNRPQFSVSGTTLTITLP